MRAFDGPTSIFLTPGEIDQVDASDDAWRDFVRRREAEFVFCRFGKPAFGAGLELGAGSCDQSPIIARYCESLVCTDVDGTRLRPRDIPHVEYKVCDAEDLSCFADATFDLVFSSNMLEHLDHPLRCLTESRRVLKPDGLVIATLPSRTWKVFNTLLSPCRLKIPRTHGSTKHHVTEFIRFGRRDWERKFRQAGLRVRQVLVLPFYVGHGPRFRPLLKFGNRLHLSASTAFILSR